MGKMRTIPERRHSSPGRMPSDIDGYCETVVCRFCGNRIDKDVAVLYDESGPEFICKKCDKAMNNE